MRDAVAPDLNQWGPSVGRRSLQWDSQKARWGLKLDLDAPVGRVAAKDTWVGYHPDLENEILPQVEDVVAEADRLLKY